jgi:hypothetical protein
MYSLKTMTRQACTNLIGHAVLPPYMKMGHAYVPYQCFGPTYAPKVALDKGTMFPDLDQPYMKKEWGY